MATFTDGSEVFDLSKLELGKSGKSAKEIAGLALNLASHAKALLGTLSEPQAVRDEALKALSGAIDAMKRLRA